MLIETQVRRAIGDAHNDPVSEYDFFARFQIKTSDMIQHVLSSLAEGPHRLLTFSPHLAEYQNVV